MCVTIIEFLEMRYPSSRPQFVLAAFAGRLCEGYVAIYLFRAVCVCAMCKMRCAIPELGLKLGLQPAFRFRFRSEICKLRMLDFEIAQRILQMCRFTNHTQDKTTRGHGRRHYSACKYASPMSILG